LNLPTSELPCVFYAQAAMELSEEQRRAMLAARARLLADMGALMRHRSRIVDMLAPAASATPARDTLCANVQFVQVRPQDARLG